MAKTVALGVCEIARRGRRWKGESMVNSSWRESVGGSLRGRQVWCAYSEREMVKVWVLLAEEESVGGDEAS